MPSAAVSLRKAALVGANTVATKLRSARGPVASPAASSADTSDDRSGVARAACARGGVREGAVEWCLEEAHRTGCRSHAAARLRHPRGRSARCSTRLDDGGAAGARAAARAGARRWRCGRCSLLRLRLLLRLLLLLAAAECAAEVLGQEAAVTATAAAKAGVGAWDERRRSDHHKQRRSQRLRHQRHRNATRHRASCDNDETELGAR